MEINVGKLVGAQSGSAHADYLASPIGDLVERTASALLGYGALGAAVAGLFLLFW